MHEKDRERTALREDRYAVLWEQGRTMSLAQAAAYALGDLDTVR